MPHLCRVELDVIHDCLQLLLGELLARQRAQPRPLQKQHTRQSTAVVRRHSALATSISTPCRVQGCCRDSPEELCSHLIQVAERVGALRRLRIRGRLRFWGRRHVCLAVIATCVWLVIEALKRICATDSSSVAILLQVIGYSTVHSVHPAAVPKSRVFELAFRS